MTSGNSPRESEAADKDLGNTLISNSLEGKPSKMTSGNSPRESEAADKDFAPGSPENGPPGSNVSLPASGALENPPSRPGKSRIPRLVDRPPTSKAKREAARRKCSCFYDVSKEDAAKRQKKEIAEEKWLSELSQVDEYLLGIQQEKDRIAAAELSIAVALSVNVDKGSKIPRLRSESHEGSVRRKELNLAQTSWLLKISQMHSFLVAIQEEKERLTAADLHEAGELSVFEENESRVLKLEMSSKIPRPRCESQKESLRRKDRKVAQETWLRKMKQLDAFLLQIEEDNENVVEADRRVAVQLRSFPGTEGRDRKLIVSSKIPRLRSESQGECDSRIRRMVEERKLRDKRELDDEYVRHREDRAVSAEQREARMSVLEVIIEEDEAVQPRVAKRKPAAKLVRPPWGAQQPKNKFVKMSDRYLSPRICTLGQKKTADGEATSPSGQGDPEGLGKSGSDQACHLNC